MFWKKTEKTHYFSTEDKAQPKKKIFVVKATSIMQAPFILKTFLNCLYVM